MEIGCTETESAFGREPTGVAGKRESMSIDSLCKMALESGVKEAKIIDPQDVVVAEWVRLKCQYGCGQYGKWLTCPPRTPTPEATRRLLAGYRTGLLLRVELAGIEDYNAKRSDFRETVSDLERRIFLANYPKAFGLSFGRCYTCESCNLTGGCRFPYTTRPSMEACGIDVSSTVKKAGWDYGVITSKESS